MWSKHSSVSLRIARRIGPSNSIRLPSRLRVAVCPSTARALIGTDSTSRTCNHWPVKFFTKACTFGSASIRLTCAGTSRRSSPAAASRNSSASGIVDQRKYDNRDARV